MMKRIKLMTSFIVLMVLGGCASAEERAARAAEQAANVKKALTERKYRIAVSRMYPRSGAAKSVSYGYSVEVRNDSLFSYLPYFGRAYQVPYGGGKGLNFSERIGSYHESQLNNGKRHIEIQVKNEEDTYLYTLDIFDNGSSQIDVQSRQREQISYSGNMEF
ncbi:MAG: DUF4251 domain-containing protein [Prevotella sp.]|nr:DUF4251 domain-containing protein [Prevotella sp.]